MHKNTFYITTPIYYPNAKPHLGTLYSTLLADIAARWQHDIMGKEAYFLTGTDEHGQKIQERAEAAGMAPQAFVDEIVPAFKELWKLYEIDHYTRFIRTTDADHIVGVEAWIKKLLDQGDIYKASYQGWYCVPCETFVNLGADPLTDTTGAYVCPTCKRALRELSEESYFFRLSAYQDQLLAFYENNPNFITPKERLNEVISFVNSGLKDLSLSRKTVSWGIPFTGDSSHTVYVWADALNNYITALGYGSDTAEAKALFEKFWPADAHVMAKDIVRFHAVYWPAFLMAAGLSMPKKLVVHGYILASDDQKMSKSLGNVMDPIQLAQDYGVEQVRYYLARQMAITHDGIFDIKDLENRINADLANNLGNLLNRVVTLAVNNGLTTVKAPETLEAKSAALREKCLETYRFVADEMDKYYYHTALAEVWKLIGAVNIYLQEMQPWVLVKTNPTLFAEVIASACCSLQTIGIMLWPVMPNKMSELLATLGVAMFQTNNGEHALTTGTNYDLFLREDAWKTEFAPKKCDAPLFVRIEPRAVAELAMPGEALAKPGANQMGGQPVPAATEEITIDEFAKVQLRVGVVEQCEMVPGSDKLYKLQVDFGSLGKRQILTGVAKHVKAEAFVGKQSMFVTNLKPRKMMGLESHGMMLFADDGTNLCPVTINGTVEHGARVK